MAEGDRLRKTFAGMKPFRFQTSRPKGCLPSGLLTKGPPPSGLPTLENDPLGRFFRSPGVGGRMASRLTLFARPVAPTPERSKSFFFSYVDSTNVFGQKVKEEP